MSEINNPQANEAAEPRRRFYHAGEFWGGLGALLLVGAFTASHVAMYRSDKADRQRTEILAGELRGQVERDGFTLEPGIERWSRNRAVGGIHITPNCSLDEVIMTYATGPDGHVTDVTSYSLRTVLNGMVSHHRAANREVTDVTGAPVTFEWVNADDLNQNILGPQVPCATLADNVGIVNHPDR